MSLIISGSNPVFDTKKRHRITQLINLVTRRERTYRMLPQIDSLSKQIAAQFYAHSNLTTKLCLPRRNRKVMATSHLFVSDYPEYENH
jgi:hypothetical protein